MALVKQDFDPYLNEKFTLGLDSGEKMSLELVEIAEKNTKHTLCFTLLFRGEKERVLAQGNYGLEHTGMGKLELFLTPVMVGKDDGIYYESVFNRLREE